MSEVTRSSRSGLIQAVVHLVNKNFDKLSQDFVKLGFLSKEVNLEPIVPAFQDVFVNAVELGVSKMDFKSVTDDMSGVMYKFPFKLPPYYALIIRSLLTLEGIALSVDPDFKILGAAYPYFARRLMEDPDPQLRERLKEMLFDNNQFKWDRLEDLLSNAAKQTNLEGFKKLGIDPDKMIEIGVQCSLEQLLEHGFFHADPHPGNLLALEDGRLCYLDFGMMSEVTRSSRSGLIQAVVHLVNKNLSLIHI